MGYISAYNKIISTIFLDKKEVKAFRERIKGDCVELILEGYKNYSNDKEKVFEIDEETITAGIYGHIENIINYKELDFVIIPEFHQITLPIQKGKLKPRRAKRFDLMIINLQSIPKHKFGVEAKLLAEQSTPQKNATTLINDYVEDKGMGKFINQIYDKDFYDEGFMLGYILNGQIDTIVNRINLKISDTYSPKERLYKQKNYYMSAYLSEGLSRELYHLFLDFSDC